MTSLLIEPYAGTLALSRIALGGLRGQRPVLEAPCAYMGAKNEIGATILRCVGIEPGEGADRWIWNDASTIGRAWSVILGPHGAGVAEQLRAWEGMEARGLWFALRAAGPPADPVAYTASWLWLQARAASGVPVWWAATPDRLLKARVGTAIPATERTQYSSADRPALVSYDGHGRGPYPAWPTGTTLLTRNQRGTECPAGGEGYDSPPPPPPAPQIPLFSLPAPERRAVSGGIQSPATIARRIDALRAAWADRDWRMDHLDASAFVDQALPEVRAEAERGSRVVAILDPPYVGATGYECRASRSAVVAQAEALRSAGAVVAVCEAAPVTEMVDAGWLAIQIPSPRKPEWVMLWLA